MFLFDLIHMEIPPTLVKGNVQERLDHGTVKKDNIKTIYTLPPEERWPDQVE